MSVTKNQIEWAMESMKDWYDGVNKLTILRSSYKEAIEALIQIKLTLEKHQRWTGQSWEQNHIADFEARKILDRIRPIIDKYSGE